METTLTAFSLQEGPNIMKGGGEKAVGGGRRERERKTEILQTILSLSMQIEGDSNGTIFPGLKSH